MTTQLLYFFTKNNKSGSRSKHIDIKYLAIRERVKDNKVVIEHIGTELMIDDPLTKSIPPFKFKDHVSRMGLGSIMWFPYLDIIVNRTLIYVIFSFCCAH